MDKYLHFSYETLKRFSEDAFCNFGFDKRQSEIITDVLLTSDLYGIDSRRANLFAEEQADKVYKAFEGTVEIKI